MSEKFTLAADQEVKVQKWLAGCDNPEMPFLEDGKGGYMNALEIVEQIRKGTRVGQELLDAILILGDSNSKQS